MSYRSYNTTLYGKKIYSLTQQLQRQKVKLANSKNQLIFLEKCITKKIIPKSFQVKSPILSKKGKILQEEYQMKLLKLARNEAKQKMYKSRSNIVTYLNVLKEQLSKDDYDTLITITEICTCGKQKETIHGHYSNYRNLCIRFRTERKI